MIILSNVNTQKDDVSINKLYGEDALLPAKDFIKKHNIQKSGLSNQEAEEKLKNLGLNQIKGTKTKKWYHYFLESLFTPFNCILIGIVAILIYTDIYLPESPSYANIIVIAILVTSSTLLDFFEEYRSNKAAEKLKELVATTTTVIRERKRNSNSDKRSCFRRLSRSFSR